METVERDFAPQGVKFYYIYKALAHPETNGYVTPFTLEERLLHISEAKAKLGSRITWLCDSMANDLKHALGNAPNSEFLIDPQGKIISAERWSQPENLRETLSELVGPVERPTSVADLEMPRLQPPKTAATGVVSRVQLPGRMTAVMVRPAASTDRDERFYVKLRAEVDSEYLQGGAGKLYLGFFLDPLYKVHWNNRAPVMTFSIDAPDGVTVDPLGDRGPSVEPDADADPREFLLDIAGEAAEPLRLTVQYIACDDAETFCLPVTQRYEIALVRDRDGGSRRAGRGMRGGRSAGRRFGPPGFGPPGFGPPGFGEGPMGEPEGNGPTVSAARLAALKRAVGLYRESDLNADGVLQRGELGKPHQTLLQADANSDRQLTLSEVIDWYEQQARDPQ